MKTAYRCNECGSVYDEEDEALDCCPPTISTVYACDVCDTVYDTEEQAETCCQDGEYRPKPSDLEAAGQMRLIP